jgi:hypothetical protein
MSTARVLIKQGATIYRFLRFETSPDGSLIAFLDRDARPKVGGVTMGRDGVFVPTQHGTDRPLPYGRFSIHTTGEVHRYVDGKRADTIHIEPLHRLTKLNCVGFFSIPRPARLDVFDEHRERHDVAGTLEVPEGVSERLTFLLEIGPNPQEPTTYGLAPAHPRPH